MAFEAGGADLARYTGDVAEMHGRCTGDTREMKERCRSSPTPNPSLTPSPDPGPNPNLAVAHEDEPLLETHLARAEQVRVSDRVRVRV